MDAGTKTVLLVALAVAAEATAQCGARPKPFSVSKETTYLTEPLGADGLVDYAAALDQKYGRATTAENNAAWLLADVLGGVSDAARARLGMPVAPPPTTRLLRLAGEGSFAERLAAREHKVRADVESTLRAQLERAHQTPWRPGDYPWLAEWLQSNERPLSVVGRAAQRPRFWVPILEFSGDLPIGVSYRDACLALTSRAMLRAGLGDGQGAREDVLTCHRLAWLSNEDPWLISRLVAVGMRATASEATAGLADPLSATPGEVRLLLRQLEPLSAPVTPLQAVGEAERYLSLQVSIVKAGTVTKDPSAWAGVWEGMAVRAGARDLASTPPAVLDWNEFLRQTNRCFDDQAAGPTAARPEAVAAGGFSASDLASLIARSATDSNVHRELSRAVAALNCVVLGRSIISYDETEARFRLARLLLATSLWKSEKETLPERLGDLSPTYLPPAAAKDVDAGYRISLHRAPDAKTFAYVATPEHPGYDGISGFCVDARARMLRVPKDVPKVAAGRCADP